MHPFHDYLCGQLDDMLKKHDIVVFYDPRREFEPFFDRELKEIGTGHDSLVLHLASLLSFCPYIGWDLLVTDDDVVVLEGNDGPDLKLHQVHRPLLADPRIRRFYEHHGVVRR